MNQTCVCPDCKAVVPLSNGPTHPYIGGNAGCWEIYGRIVEKEFSNPSYMKVHRLTVDAYAAQHPGKNESRSAQSVNIHLVALYLVIEKKVPFDKTTKLLGELVKKRNHQFSWLTPPDFLGDITVCDVVTADTPEQHYEKVETWAKSVWQCWKQHHPFIKDITNGLL